MASLLPMLQQRSLHITCPYNEAANGVPTPASLFAGLHDVCMTPHTHPRCTHPRHRIQANKRINLRYGDTVAVGKNTQTRLVVETQSLKEQIRTGKNHHNFNKLTTAYDGQRIALDRSHLPSKFPHVRLSMKELPCSG
ncbi:MAG: hypothetical protein ACPGLY_01675 [Rubripirellula sp.]